MLDAQVRTVLGRDLVPEMGDGVLYGQRGLQTGAAFLPDTAPADHVGQGRRRHGRADDIDQVPRHRGQVVADIAAIYVLDPVAAGGHSLGRMAEERRAVVAESRTKIDRRGGVMLLIARIEDVDRPADIGPHPDMVHLRTDQGSTAGDVHQDRDPGIPENVGNDIGIVRSAEPCRQLRLGQIDAAVNVSGTIPRRLQQGNQERGLVEVVAPAVEQGRGGISDRTVDQLVLDPVADELVEQRRIMAQAAGKFLDIRCNLRFVAELRS